MDKLKFWLLGIVSCIAVLVGTVFIPNLLSHYPGLGIQFNQPALAFDSFNRAEEGHRGITETALKGNGKQWPQIKVENIQDSGKVYFFKDQAIKEIERSVRGVDLKESYLDFKDIGLSQVTITGANKLSDSWPFSPDFDYSYKHFDRETFPEGSLRLIHLKKRIERILRSITDASAAQTQGTEARQLLGQALHTLQDFYAHSNWVELKKPTINQDLGRKILCEIPSGAQMATMDSKDVDLNDLVNIVVSVETPCASRFLDQRSKLAVEPTAIAAVSCTTASFGIAQVGDRPNPADCRAYNPGTFNSEFKKLTSGYFMGVGPIDSCEAPPGKTRHGSSLFGCPEGLNKDGPGIKGYSEAFDFAVTATQDYIHQVIDPLVEAQNFEAIKALMGWTDSPQSACAQTGNGEACRSYDFKVIARSGDTISELGNQKVQLNWGGLETAKMDNNGNVFYKVFLNSSSGAVALLKDRQTLHYIGQNIGDIPVRGIGEFFVFRPGNVDVLLSVGRDIGSGEHTLIVRNGSSIVFDSRNVPDFQRGSMSFITKIEHPEHYYAEYFAKGVPHYLEDGQQQITQSDIPTERNISFSPHCVRNHQGQEVCDGELTPGTRNWVLKLASGKVLPGVGQPLAINERGQVLASNGGGNIGLSWNQGVPISAKPDVNTANSDWRFWNPGGGKSVIIKPGLSVFDYTYDAKPVTYRFSLAEYLAPMIKMPPGTQGRSFSRLFTDSFNDRGQILLFRSTKEGMELIVASPRNTAR